MIERAKQQGFLVREFSVLMIDYSASGCLFESNAAFAIGDSGVLHVTIAGVSLDETIEIVRCQRVAGGSGYHVGARFVWPPLLARDGPQFTACPAKGLAVRGLFAQSVSPRERAVRKHGAKPRLARARAHGSALARAVSKERQR